MASDQKLKEFRQELWDLIIDYAPEDGESSDKFMVAGALLATTLEIYVLTMGKESTIHIVEHAIESVKQDSYKRKLH